MISKYYLLLLLFLGFLNVNAQKAKSRATLEREKKANLEKINSVNEILKEARSNKKMSLGQVKAINVQIENKEAQINLAQDEILILKEESKVLFAKQNALKLKKQKIQKDYAETIYRASKKSNQITKLSFLFSSGSIRELFLRYKYLDQYTENRKHQLTQIKALNSQIVKRQLEIDKKNEVQQKVIAEINQQKTKLEGLKSEQNAIIKELTLKEKELKIELDKSKVAVNNLNSLIEKIINRETVLAKVEKENAKAEKEKPENTTPKEVSSPKAATSIIKRGSSFSGQKARLPWPVNGFISDKFGIKPHPALKGIKIDNNGIDIQTSNSAEVHAVFEGKVLDISEIPGLNYVVAIQHGDYYTVYANLQNVSVKINENISYNQKIGTAGKKDGTSEINFQIWHNFDKLNPESWLEPK